MLIMETLGCGQLHLNRFEYYLGVATLHRVLAHGGYAQWPFPSNSKGDSPKQQFNDFGVKGGAT
jgi:hypothetical protein